MFAYPLSISVLRHDQIHNNGCQEYNGNTVLSEDGANDVGENMKHFRNLGKAQADAHGQCRNGDIAPAEAAGTLPSRE
jgi:hypothetical protein